MFEIIKSDAGLIVRLNQIRLRYSDSIQVKEDVLI